jgi:uncharacterized phage protein gp47/JayE
LRDVRGLVRDSIRGRLPGADATVPNSVLRVMSDAQGALCHLTLQYVDWLARQLLPDTAETEWLDRHGDIWLVNADGTTGRKMATLAQGIVEFISADGGIYPVPTGTRLSWSSIEYETTEDIVTGTLPAQATARALDPGAAGNAPAGSSLGVIGNLTGVTSATVVEMDGGTDEESDENLRVRVLSRIRNPPMGGAQADYVNWALAVPGVTRAWAASEQGPGTITVRFLMDELRADDNGWPTSTDIQTVHNYIDKMRPVTVMDCYVVAPIKQFIDIEIAELVPSTTSAADAIEKSIRDMLHQVAAPGATIYGVWISFAIMSTPEVVSFNLVTVDDYVMPSLGHMAVLGTILYDTPPS